jgi:hypothetical protein
MGPERFIHEMGIAAPAAQPKAVVHASTLPDETQVVRLEARGRTG